MVVSSADLSDQALVVASIKRHGAVHQSVEQNPQRPAVHLGPFIRPTIYDFRRGVKRTAAVRLQILITSIQVRQAKISNLWPFTLITDHVPLQWLSKAKDSNPRVTRWFLLCCYF